MATIANKRLMAINQKGFKTEIGTAFAGLGEQLRGVILRYADASGIIPVRQIGNVQREAGNMLVRFFVGMDGRSPFAQDGITPLATYPRILNKWLARVVADNVLVHSRWMKRNVPEDVYDWLATVPSRSAPIVVSEMIHLSLAEIDALRLFHPNPLAEYEPSHTWVDPRGYVLSDRIWQTSVQTRAKLDLFLAERIRAGQGAFQMAKELEQFLNPNRRPFRTKKPYGKDASYDAMRLARTEIARAGNQAAFISSYLNPYVDKLEVVRSPNGDIKCTICPQHATIGIGGERLREPYSIETADIPPYHAHDMCRVEPIVTDSPSTISDRWRTIIEEAEVDELPLPYVSPAQPTSLIRQLLGVVLMGAIADYLQEKVLN